MSGFGAIVRFDDGPIESETLERFAQALRFRAPDGERTLRIDHAGFAVARMHIAGDPPEADMPLCLDERWWMVGDVRLYGRDDLVRSLRGAGADASVDRSDPWLVLLAYKAWGEQCVSRFNGTFSFALWDARDRRLFCACDHFGERPLFYSTDAAGLWVSNTLTALRDVLGQTELNDLFIADFLTLEISLVPDATAYRHIHRLPPAHTLTVTRGGKPKAAKYWTLPTRGPNLALSAADTRARFLELLDQAVRDRLPRGATSIWLSGGMDSTSIAALASATGHADLLCATIGSTNASVDPEPPIARRVADTLHLAHRFHSNDDQVLFDGWHSRVPHMPEPWHDPHWGGTLRAYCDLAHRGRVVVSGEAGDEVLCPEFGLELVNRVPVPRLVSDVVRHVRRYQRLPPMGVRKTIRRWRGVADPPPRLPTWLNTDLTREWNVEERMADNYRAAGDPFPTGVRPMGATRMNRAIRVTRDSNDAGTIGLPLETRKPFLDLRLVEFLFSLPPLYWFSRKAILREAMAGRLPMEVLQRPKTGIPPSVFAKDLDRRHAALWDRFTPSPSLGRYVDLSKLEELRRRAPAVPPEDAWRNLLPLSLNYWLRSLTA